MINWFKKMRFRIIRWFNETFKGYKYTNVGDFEKEKRCLSKSQIVREIIEVSAKINNSFAVVPADYKKELKSQGKRRLIKTLAILTMAHTQKINGVKYA